MAQLHSLIALCSPFVHRGWYDVTEGLIVGHLFRSMESA